MSGEAVYLAHCKQQYIYIFFVIFFHVTLKGNWLSKRPELRSRLIIATKVWGPMDKNDPNARGLSRHHIMCAVEQSLQRLQTDYIDLYQVSTHTYPCIQGWLPRAFNV